MRRREPRVVGLADPGVLNLVRFEILTGPTPTSAVLVYVCVSVYVVPDVSVCGLFVRL